MRLPTPLSRRNKNAHKNSFGHLLVLAGSAEMLGAAALTALAAMRAGAGLVTLGVPKSLTAAAQKKAANVVMTWGLPQTKTQSLSPKSFDAIVKRKTKFTAAAIGPGLSAHPETQKLVRQIAARLELPLVIDADALNALAGHLEILKKPKAPRILTPHPGEMSRLTGTSKKMIEANRKKAVRAFTNRYPCVLLLKGHRTLVGGKGKKIYTNTTGNSGMATAGSGDVLTGIIGAFLAQGLNAFDAARLGAYFHGKTGDRAARAKTRVSLIASDIIDALAGVIK